MSGCLELAKTEYIQRHNKAAAYFHWTVCKHYDIKIQDKHNEHEPAAVTGNQTATILWDMPIQTDKEIKANQQTRHSGGRQEGKKLPTYGCLSQQKGTPH